jgi:hypothetical protein
MNLKLTKIYTPKIDGTDDLALNIGDVSQRLIKEHLQRQEVFLENVLRNNAEPKVKGEITRGKVKWRGIMIIEQKTPNGWNMWVEQRGKRISEIVTHEYNVLNVG